uniref:Predicted protein n=1 Tax=Hordeum vulgare subsp. vulgare TaxID=112509 RepID=F2EL45_HORVV|nr:predicted protein [Hordeum vulgare subsp. vulgare]
MAVCSPWSSLRASFPRRRLYVCACSGEVGPDNASAASPAVRTPTSPRLWMKFLWIGCKQYQLQMAASDMC